MLLGTRYIGSRWTTWFQKIETIDDMTLREWHVRREMAGNEVSIENMTEPALLKAARQNLLREVLKEKSKFFFEKKSNDPTVLILAKSYDATVFLMVCLSAIFASQVSANKIELVRSILGHAQAHSIQLNMECASKSRPESD